MRGAGSNSVALVMRSWNATSHERHHIVNQKALLEVVAAITWIPKLGKTQVRILLEFSHLHLEVQAKDDIEEGRSIAATI